MIIPHRGLRFQRGRGIGSLFSGLFRTLKPLAIMGLKAGKNFLSSTAGQQIKETVKDVGKSMLKNVAADILEGKNVGESAKEQIQDVKTKIAQSLRGSGKRKGRKNIKYHQKRLRYSLLDDE